MQEEEGGDVRVPGTGGTVVVSSVLCISHLFNCLSLVFSPLLFLFSSSSLPLLFLNIPFVIRGVVQASHSSSKLELIHVHAGHTHVSSPLSPPPPSPPMYTLAHRPPSLPISFLLFLLTSLNPSLERTPPCCPLTATSLLPPFLLPLPSSSLPLLSLLSPLSLLLPSLPLFYTFLFSFSETNTAYEMCNLVL